MPQIGSPFDEPQRQISIGEKEQSFANLSAAAVRLFLNLEMSEKERDAVATLAGLFHRWQSLH